MASRADDLIDRSRLRRKLTFWRAATVLLIAAAIGVSAWLMSGERFGALAAAHVAKVRIEGTITEDDELIDRLKTIGENDAVKGVILAIDSPGGTTAGGEATYEAVRALAQKKPVVAQVGTLAASAGYMIASASDHIVARQSSIVGSIGVLVQFPDLTGLMDKIGVKLEEVKSSPLKAEPNPFNPTTDEERAMIRAMILDSYEWFVALVAERRPMTPAEARTLADGSVFTGRQALQHKLVDALGGEDKAREWLTAKGVDGDLEVVEWKKKRSGGYLLPGAFAHDIARALGLSGLASEIGRGVGADRMFLDGLVSVWHPEKALSTD